MDRSFSATLSELRRRRGLSQRSAAADLRISQALLSHYENGAREPGLEFVSRACDYYGVTSDYLLGRSDSETGAETGLDATAATALASLTAVLRSSRNNSLSAAADRYVTAALLKTAVRVTENDPASADILSLELAAAELELLRTLNRLSETGLTEQPLLGGEAKRLISDIKNRLL